MRKLSSAFSGLFDIDDAEVSVSHESEIQDLMPELIPMLSHWIRTEYPVAYKELLNAGIECPYSLRVEKDNIVISTRSDIEDIVPFANEYTSEVLDLDAALLTSFCKIHRKGLIIDGDIRDIYILGPEFATTELDKVRLLCRPNNRSELSNIHLESRDKIRLSGSEIGIETQYLNKLDNTKGGALIIQCSQIHLEQTQLRTRGLLLTGVHRDRMPGIYTKNLKLPQLGLRNSEFRLQLNAHTHNWFSSRATGTGLRLSLPELSKILRVPAELLEFYISKKPENCRLENLYARKNQKLGISQVSSDEYLIKVL